MKKPSGEVFCYSNHYRILKTIAIITGLNFVILIIIATCFSWWISQNYYGTKVNEIEPPNRLSTTPVLPTLRIITRAEWDAQPPKQNTTKLQPPVNRVIILHTASQLCSNESVCAKIVRDIQTNDMVTRAWDDIGLNFLVGGDGAVYEGRGWDNQGAHTRNNNNGSIGVGLIGTFKTNPPAQLQFDVLRLLLDEGVRLNKLTDNYKMYPHRAFSKTDNPGRTVIRVIKYWPHYADIF